jgi:hypothetical protein
MKKMHQPNMREGFKIKHFAGGLALLAITATAGLAAFGFVQNRKEDKHILQSYSGLKSYVVQPGDTYFAIVARDRREHPELKRFSIDNLVYEVYTPFHNHDSYLTAGETIYIPNWEKKE